MAGVRLSLTLDDAQLRLGTQSLLDAAKNLRPIMAIAGGIFENSTRNRFANERGPGGIPWVQSWRARETGGTTLQDKGLLLGSIRSNVGDNFVETGVDGRSVSAKYAATHQYGATIRAKNGKALAFTGPDGSFNMVQSVTIPARPFMGIDDDDLTDLRLAFIDYLESAIDGN